MTPEWKDGDPTHGKRWYCLSRDGMAMLCANERDAQRNAADADLAFPKAAPHKAVRMEQIAAPEWKDGKPANLAAAAMDADEWLALLQKMYRCGRATFARPEVSIPKLESCRAALAEMLKGKE